VIHIAFKNFSYSSYVQPGKPAFKSAKPPVTDKVGDIALRSLSWSLPSVKTSKTT